MKIEKAVSKDGKQYMILVDDEMRIIPEILQFTKYIYDTKKLSINTVESYIRDLKIFYEWLHTVELQFWEVKSQNIPQFMKYVDEQAGGEKQASSMNRILSTLSSFYRYFSLMDGVISKNPVIMIKGMMKPDAGRSFLHHTIKHKSVIDVHYFKRKIFTKLDRKRLYEEEVDLFYKTIGSSVEMNDSIRFRNQLTFQIMYETGIRIGELLHLRLMDYDLPSPDKKCGNIYLIERSVETDPDRQLKTGERTIPVSIHLLELIDQYVTEYRPYIQHVEHIFVAHKGRQIGYPVSRSQIEDMFRKISKICGVKCTPHSLRHTHASNLADAQWDPLYIKSRLGHKSIYTSAIYAKPSLETQIQSYENYLKSKEGNLF
ncbi:tyrosine-type recombinase/integrase [Bacillus thuringiensis]|nr:tyrosine-type recombinase/integrase [Bacillus thuringiensis]